MRIFGISLVTIGLVAIAAYLGNRGTFKTAFGAVGL